MLSTANKPEEMILETKTPFQTRIAALQVRVNEAASTLHGQGIQLSVQRIRAALGGGSPNDLTPALRHWREEVLPNLTPLADERSGPPLQVADLMRELWTRALAAASIDKRGGDKAIALVARSEEVRSLREQISSLRDQLEREAVSYGELRAQAARHEAIAKDAMGRVREIEQRERKALHELGAAKQRIAELGAKAERSRPQRITTARAARPRSVKSARSSQRQKKRKSLTPRGTAKSNRSTRRHRNRRT